MPLEDGLPTYEEATGLKRILPHNIAREITRAISEPDEGSSSCCSLSSKFCFLLVTGLLSVLGLGILMIVIGFTSLDVCPHSMLPTWLLGSGSGIVALFVLPFLLRCLPTDSEGKRCCLPTVCAAVFFCMIIGYCAGCYWTWGVGSAACVRHVYWLSLVVTSLPIICIIGIVCKGCVIPRMC